MNSEIEKIEEIVEKHGHSITEWREFAKELNLYESEFFVKMFLSNTTKTFLAFMKWRQRKYLESRNKVVPGAESGQS